MRLDAMTWPHLWWVDKCARTSDNAPAQKSGREDRMVQVETSPNVKTR